MSAPNSGDQAWMLASTALVQLMTPGVAFFYGGLVGEGSVVNTMMLSYGCMAVVSVLWSLVGYSLAFGPNISSQVVGDLTYAPVDKISPLTGGFPTLRQVGIDAAGAPIMSTITEHTYSMFQLMFAIITPALISGAIVQRMKFVWFMAFVALWHIFVYCPLAHWFFFYDGWAFKYGIIEFAGGMVIHTASGVSALTLAFWLGRGAAKPHVKPHNVPYVLLGAGLLWFGWFGFNAGSALASGYSAGLAFSTTQYGGAAGMFAWGLMEMVFSGDKWFSGRPTAVGAATGAILGLVGITPGAGFVSPNWAIFIGAFTAASCFFAPKLMNMAGIDDRLDCFAIHGVGGMVGSALAGLFADERVSLLPGMNGSFFNNPIELGKQCAGISATILMCVVSTTIIFWVLEGTARLLKTTTAILPSESAAVDVSQHGEKAYYKAAGAAAPAVDAESGLSLRTVAPETK